MGSSASAEEKEEARRREEEYFKQQLATPPDLKVNGSLQMFTGLSCSDSLKVHLARRREEVVFSAPDLIKALVEKVAGLSPCPELAGLGALALAVFIDSISNTPSDQSIKDALREVLAEQKASEVWDLVDETLKRCVVNVQNRTELARDVQRLEEMLSLALTRLRNSMLRDGHISNQALKVWVHGAAFHVQMLIHQVRLGGARTCEDVERLISVYKSDLEELFRKHQEMIKSKCKYGHEYMGQGCSRYYLANEDSREYTLRPILTYHEHLQVYYQHQYGRQEGEIQGYFSGVQRDLQQLVGQEGHLSLV